MPSFSLEELAGQVDGCVVGCCDESISSVASLAMAQPGQLSFIAGDAHLAALKSTQAGVVVMAEQYQTHSPVPALVVDHAELAFAKLAALFLPERSSLMPAASAEAIIATSAVIDPSARIGAGCVIGEFVEIGANTQVMPGVVIGDRCRIGADCVLHSNVTLYHDVCFGDRVVAHSGAIIGSDGFGHVLHEGKWHTMPQLGGVTIGDDVLIGANTTIDRGALEDTVIEEGVKLDNLIQIGHNVHIGAHTAIAGCVGIAGSTTIGKHCMIGGASGINGHITITDNVFLTGMTAVTQCILKPGVYSSGTSLQENLAWRKTVARLHQLNDWVKRIKKLERLHDDRDGQ